MKFTVLSTIALAIPCFAADLPAEEVTLTPQQINFFEKKIRPVLVEHCYECHSEAEEIEGKLRVDLREGLLQGGETGPAIVPMNIQESLLIASIEYRDGLEMPPEKQLPEDVIRDFKRWVRMGAPDPRSGTMSTPAKDKSETANDPLWSLQPVERPEIPDVKDTDWPKSDMDRFLLAQMEQAGVSPVEDAEPVTLLRRVTFDLTGLPPRPEVVLQFLQSPSEAAYQAYVDQLLNSPQFGERWARHWFDVARYAESAGSSRDVLMPYAWRYRDYVIDAMNADIPYDRFITEQIAGDLLETENVGEHDRLRIATGFLAIGSKSLNGGNLVLDIVDDQIDVIGKAVLGMTISCARCHDHKFDPIPTADYYAIAGIFRCTETLYGGSTNRPKTLEDEFKVYLPLGNSEDQTAAQEYIKTEKELAKLNKQKAATAKEIQAALKKLPKDWKDHEAAIAALTEADEITEEQKKLQTEIETYRKAQKKHRELLAKIEELKNLPTPEVDWTIGVREHKKIADHTIQVRGEPKNSGDVVSRGFLSAVSLQNEHAERITKESSGRRELAAWLVDPQHPLTPRVAVNRIWMHLFGKGLADQVDNLGTTAQSPTHPELLDYLAHHFVNDLGWSRKKMIREIVLSRAYQLAHSHQEKNAAVDFTNQYYWKHDRRRLEAEALRDATLQASGELNLERPYASIVSQIGEGEVGRGIKVELLDQPYPYRSVYLPIIRGIVPEMMKIFDFPEPSNPQGTRLTTNVPAQSLFLMNSPFVIEQSEKLAETLIEAADGDRERIETMYLATVSRPPQDSEVDIATDYLNQCRHGLLMGEIPADEREQVAWSTLCQALFACAEFRYVD